MKRMRRELAGFLVAPALLASACAGPVVSDAYTIENEPSKVEALAGTDRVQVVLTDQAARRLGVATTSVARTAAGLVVPSAAVFVEPDGKWWLYTNPKPRVYVRQEVALVRDDGGRALLSSGPPPGTTVVTVGVAELRGVEDDIGH
jgi:hypothetical protein